MEELKRHSTNGFYPHLRTCHSRVSEKKKAGSLDVSKSESTTMIIQKTQELSF
jgi:hypothetical protein